MKKYLPIIAAIALVGCNDEVLVENVDTAEVPVAFSTYTSKVTRAENSSDTAVNKLETYNTTFKVWGSKYIGASETQVFTADVVTNDGTKWNYSPVRFWDKSATSYDFYAASPSSYSWDWDNAAKKLSLADFAVSGTNRVVTGGTNWAAFGVQTSVSASAVMADPAAGEDLMISTDVTGYTTYSSSPVNLHFNHILSRLNIGVRKAEILDTFTVKLNSIKVYNMTSNGTFTESAASGTTLSAGTVTRWGAATTPATFTSGVGYDETELEVTSTTSNASSAYQYVYQGLVIPQTVAYNPTVAVADYDAAATSAQLKLDGSNATATSAPYIVIDYSIYDSSTLVDRYKYYYNLADVFNADGTDGIDFCEGWQNTLKITLSPVAIEFDADVYEWDVKKDTAVNVTD